jgi:hypothetical protein
MGLAHPRRPDNPQYGREQPSGLEKRSVNAVIGRGNVAEAKDDESHHQANNQRQFEPWFWPRPERPFGNVLNLTFCFHEPAFSPLTANPPHRSREQDVSLRGSSIFSFFDLRMKKPFIFFKQVQVGSFKPRG